MPRSPFSRILGIWLFCAAVTQAAVPTITNPTATPTANGDATLSATVTTSSKDTAVIFSYGRTTDYNATKTVIVSSGTASQTATAALTDLVGGQTYHFRVGASNADGSATPSADQTFVTATYLPTLKLLPPVHSNGVQTVRATVTANGTAGNVFYQYGTTTSYGNVSTTVVLAAGDENRLVEFAIPDPQLIYHYGLVFDDGTGGAPEEMSDDDVTNRIPEALSDDIKITTSRPTKIDVRANDTDANGDSLTITFVSAPKNGTTTTNGKTITYTPGANFRTIDGFTYTIDDGFTGIAKGTVTISTLAATLSGTHGGIVKQANGKEAGFFQLTSMMGGGFSGAVTINGKRYSLSGVLGIDGSFRGFASGSAGMIAVSLSTVAGETGSEIMASFGYGAYTANLNVDDTEGEKRADLNGRYTVELGGGTSGVTGVTTTGEANGTTTVSVSTANTSGAATSGWLAVRARYDGTAKVKGRLADGQSFSTRGTVDFINGTATLSFYDEGDDTRIVGALTIGDKVGGTVHVDRHRSGEGFYADGYDLMQSASGAKYIPPDDGKRVLDTDGGKGQTLTVAFTGGALSGSISRTIFLDDDDKARVLNGGDEDLKFKVDRKSGRFDAKVTDVNTGKRIKANGVLIQAGQESAGGRGVGVFKSSQITGTVTISGGVNSTTQNITDPIINTPLPQIDPNTGQVVEPNTLPTQ